MSKINWIVGTSGSAELLVGSGNQTFPDVINRPLRLIVSSSQLDPDQDFQGFAQLHHSHSASDIVTGSLNLTSSWASNAVTASAATSLTFIPVSSSYAATASVATSITFVPPTSSYAITASFAANAGSSFSNTGSFTGSLTGSVQGNALTATTASAATSITFIPVTSSYALTASFALNGGGSSSLSNTGSFTGSLTGSVLGNASTATTASFAVTAAIALTSSGSITNAVTASYAMTSSQAGIKGMYTVTDYGLVGDGTTDDSVVLNTLVNTTIPNSRQATVYFPPNRTYMLRSDTKIPANIDLWVPNGAFLLLQSGTIFTHRGGFINTGIYQFFKFDKTTDGHGLVRFSYPGDLGTNHREARNAVVYSEWWGAQGDAVTDDTFAMQSAVDATMGQPSLPYTYDRNYVISGISGSQIYVSGNIYWPLNVFTACTFTDTTIGYSATISGSSSGSIFLNSVTGTIQTGDTININLASSTPRWADVGIMWCSAVYKHLNPIQFVNVLGHSMFGQGPQLTMFLPGFATNISATSGTINTLNVAGTPYTNNQYATKFNIWLLCTSGANAGVANRIKSNTTSSFTFVNNWNFAPESGSTYTILPECGFDLNGYFQCTIHGGFTISPQNTIAGIYYRRDPAESARGSSQLNAEYVEVGNGPCLYGWAMGGLDYFDELQEDNTHLVGCKATGQSSPTYTGYYWKSGLHYGTGLFSNNLNHSAVNIDSIGWQHNIDIDTTNLNIVGTELAEAGTDDIFINIGMQGYSSVQNVRSENSPRFLIYNYNPDGVFWTFDINSVEFDAGNMFVDTVTSASSFIQWAGSGDINIKNLRAGAVPYTYSSASGGTTASIYDTSVSWSINQKQFWYVDILSGPSSGYSGLVLSNNSGTLNVSPTMSFAPVSGTTAYKLYQAPNIWAYDYGSINVDNIGLMLGTIERSIRPAFSVAHIQNFYELDEGDQIIGRWKNVYLSPTQFYRTIGGMRFGTYGKVPSAIIDYVGNGNIGITSLTTPSLWVRDCTPVAGLAVCTTTPTGSTTYNYKLVARDANGSCSLPSPQFSVANCPPTLSVGTFAPHISIYPPFPDGGPWEPVGNYDILKDRGDGTFGSIGINVPIERMIFFRDVGQPIMSYSFAATGSTGQLTVDSSASFKGSVTILGNLNATASNALNVSTASFALTSSLLLGSVVSASYAGTASILLGSIQTASFAITASNATTASFALNALGNVNASQVQPGTYPSGGFVYTGSLQVTGTLGASSVISTTAAGTAITSINGGLQFAGGYIGAYASSLGLAKGSFIGWTSFGDNVQNASASLISDDPTGAKSGVIRVIPATSAGGPIPNAFRIYSTGKTTTNAELAFIGYYTSSTPLTIGTEIAGTGSLRGINFAITGSTVAAVQTDGGVSASYFIGDGKQVHNVVSSSFATTASAATSITFTPATASYAITSSYVGTLTGLTISGNLNISGTISANLSYKIVTGSYTASTSDNYLIGNGAGGQVAILLPTTSLGTIDIQFGRKDATAANSMSIFPAGTDKLGYAGSSSLIVTRLTPLELVSDQNGTWFIASYA